MTKRQQKQLLIAITAVVLFAVQALADRLTPSRPSTAAEHNVTAQPVPSNASPRPAAHTSSAELSGTVIKVSDGDTLTLLTADKQQVKVRLGEIDSPEKKQPWGSKSRQALNERVYQRDVELAVQDIDRYGRVVALVFVDGQEINRQLIADGHAWAYRDYLKRPELIRLEEAARQAQRGLWSLPANERQAPWEWRRAQRSAR